MKRIWLVYFLSVLCWHSEAQNSIGTSNILNYTNLVYGGGTQNWDIKQGENGIMYFGNNDGLLAFDGSYWKLYPLPNKTVIRSVEIGPDHRLFVGGQNEIGFFSPDERGDLHYTSLVGLLPAKERSFADVWNIVCYNESIFFRTSSKIMQLTAGRFTIYANEDWRFLGSNKKELIAQDHKNQLWVFTNNTWAPLINQKVLPRDFLVTSLIPFSGDTSMVTTLKDGVYLLFNNSLSRLNSNTLDYITQKNIYTALYVSNNEFLLATSLGGCFLVNSKGNLIQSFSTSNGLQNNNVRHAYLDKSSNLWLGLDNGIDFIAYSNAIKQIIPDNQNKGAGYAAIIHDGSLYLGMSNGLYSLKLDSNPNISLTKGSFEPVTGSKGQVWSLAEVNGHLLMAHHEGSFEIKNNIAEPFDNSSGFWTFLPLFKQPSPIMLAGNYQGVNFYNYDKGAFVNTNIRARFESSRIIAVDNENIWVAHPYKGVFKINFVAPSSSVIQSYTNNKGLRSVNHFYIYKIRNRIVVPTEKGFFEYNATVDSFQRSSFFEKIFGDIKANYLKEDPSGNIWFTSEKNLGVVDFSGPEPRIIYITELTGKIVRGFEFIYPVDTKNILVGGEEGFYHIDYEQYRKNANKIEVLIRAVKTMNRTDSLIFGGYYKDDKEVTPSLPYRLNSVHFEYSSILYGQQSNIEYSFFLKGFDKGWSDWVKKTDKDYTNLPAGTYVFGVKARNNLGNESSPAYYSFTILSPWYQTIWAYLAYSILVFLVIYFLYKRQEIKFKEQKNRYEEEQKQLQYLHQLELDRNEKVIVKLENEKLETEINHKNKELAAATMHLVQKGELLAKLRDEMVRMLKNSGKEESLDEFNRLIRMMTDDEKFDQDWEQFSFHFDRVHGDFLMSLKNKFPKLTPIELKLCAYLRMNLSTKEMAQLMNITVRGVEVSRYRLRKKLNIPTEANLYNFLIGCIKEPAHTNDETQIKS